MIIFEFLQRKFMSHLGKEFTFTCLANEGRPLGEFQWMVGKPGEVDTEILPNDDSETDAGIFRNNDGSGTDTEILPNDESGTETETVNRGSRGKKPLRFLQWLLMLAFVLTTVLFRLLSYSLIFVHLFLFFLPLIIIALNFSVHILLRCVWSI